METINSIGDLRKKLSLEREKGQTIGFVPTMGFFHRGHLELIKKARAENDLVVVSIFVNPTQFGPNEDYKKYPRNLKKDKKLASQIGVDYIFTPSADEIYPEDFSTYVKVEGMSNLLCGKYRRGHFRGVTTVVAILFNIVRPDRAYFGAKDYQQLVIIKKMVKDLNFGIEIREVSIVREKDGLAMSSRNEYLNPEERQVALVINKALRETKETFLQGQRHTGVILEKAEKVLNNEPAFKLEYLDICDAENLENINEISKKAIVAVAGYVGQTRLIDNIILNP